MIYSNDEHELLLHWFKEIGKTVEMYAEPKLDSTTVRFFKEVCDTFDQNTHVFILSIEIAEAFIRAKNAMNQKIRDSVLAAVTITFLSHKCVGAPESLKIKHVVDVLFHLSQRVYSPTQITAMEGDVLVTLNGKIPITTTLDDLNVIIEKYVRECRLRGNVRPLCLKLLEFVFVERKTWFYELKKIYSQNRDCILVFQKLICSNVFVPASILITALQLCHYKHVLDLDDILKDITKHTNIHGDHIRVSVAKILEIIN